jgi:DNA-directed RNA polymerase specialized sigma24 family protein
MAHLSHLELQPFSGSSEGRRGDWDPVCIVLRRPTREVRARTLSFAAAKSWVSMHPKQETKSSPAFLLNEVDRFGRHIDPAVLSAAKEIGPRAVSYAERLLADPALAISFFEQAAATVSEALEVKKSSGAPVVKNLPAYLFRAFIRIVDQARRKNASLEESIRTYAVTEDWRGEATRAEASLLVDEVMEACDRASREVVVLRLEGFSWKEIGKQFDISSHAAEARFSKALDHARKVFKIRRRKG